MISHKKNPSQVSFFSTFEEMLNRKHPLYILANKIQWEVFEIEFSSLYCPNNGRPAKAIRLMVGLLMLKHIRNVSDESVVEQWSENRKRYFELGKKFERTVELALKNENSPEYHIHNE